MNKKQLISAMHPNTGLSLAATERALNQILEAVTKALADGDIVTLVGFGSFTVRRRAARVGVDPRTGSKIDLPSKNLPKFSAGSSIKTAVNCEK